jgi:hypothetical protein
MKLTKEVFEMTARIFREMDTNHIGTEAKMVRAQLITKFAHEFNKYNPEFDTEQFVRACQRRLNKHV